MRGGISQVFRKLVLVAVALAALAGCSKYNDPDNNDLFTDYGIAYKYNSGENVDYYILRDDGAVLFIQKMLWETEPFDNGERVKLSYQISDNATRAAGEAKSYDITVYYISAIQVNEPLTQSFIARDEGHRRDSIGDDPLGKITRLEFSGGFLNVGYSIYKLAENPHLMNLVIDDVSEADDDGITLYIRYNAMGDLPKSMYSDFTVEESEVSFRMKRLMEEYKNPVRITFRWMEFGAGEKEKTGVYTLGTNYYKQIVGSTGKSISPHYPAGDK